MADFSVEKMWKALMRDPETAKTPKAMLDAVKDPFFMKVPQILAEYLEQPVTLESITLAKLAWLRYCSDNGYIKAAIDAAPEGSFGFFSNEAMAEMMASMFAQLIEMAEKLSKSVPAILKAQGITEDQLLASPNVGFSPGTLALYRSGKLTIAQLLERQPAVILANK